MMNDDDDSGQDGDNDDVADDNNGDDKVDLVHIGRDEQVVRPHIALWEKNLKKRDDPKERRFYQYKI